MRPWTVAPLLLALCLPGLAVLGGCSAADGMQEKLYTATRGYNGSLRWSDWDRAAEHLPPESADGFLDSHESLQEKLVVLDYELTRLKLDKQTGRAACRVQVTWHTDDNLVVETTTVDQWWQFFEGSWYLVDERRVSGKPLALFAELDDGEKLEDHPLAAGVDPEDLVTEGSEGEALDHPYLPGLDRFRDSRDIGLDEDEKRKRDRARRRMARKAKKAGVPAAVPDMGAPRRAEDDAWSAGDPEPGREHASTLRGW